MVWSFSVVACLLVGAFFLFIFLFFFFFFYLLVFFLKVGWFA